MICPAPLTKKDQNGFTLVELLIVVSLIAIITGTMVPNFSSYIQNQNLRQAQEQIKNDLRDLQNRALSGFQALSGAGNFKYWGVKFTDEQKYYVFFKSTASDVSTCNGITTGEERSENLPGNAVVKNGTYCLFFSFENGDIITTGTTSIVVGYPNSSTDTSCYPIEFNTSGLIKGSTSSVACE